MTLHDILMLAIAVIGGASAILVVTARNVIHAALYLVVALLAVAATYLVLGAEFLAWTQVLVYVGAVVVLILFGLMLTRAPIGSVPQENEQRGLALAVSVALFGFLVVVTMLAFGGTRLPLTHTTAANIGEVLYTWWAFPFMTLGFLLTVALIGAIVIARREEGEGPEALVEDAAWAERREPAPSDASATPGVTEPAEERPTREVV